MAEAAMVGVAVGMAINALKPIPGMEFSGFSYHAFTQIENRARRMRWRTRGAAIPIVLVSLTQSYVTVFWALALYVAVQTLESNVLAPLVQMEMVQLDPGTILIMQLIMVVLFGAAGLALATPLTAVGTVMVQRLYVEDWLGDCARG